MRSSRARKALSLPVEMETWLRAASSGDAAVSGDGWVTATNQISWYPDWSCSLCLPL